MDSYTINEVLADSIPLRTHFVSGIVKKQEHTAISIQCSWTKSSAPVGSLQLQVSDDGENFEDEGPPVDLGSGTHGTIVNFRFLQSYWLIRYTRTSGGESDTMRIVYTMKVA